MIALLTKHLIALVRAFKVVQHCSAGDKSECCCITHCISHCQHRHACGYHLHTSQKRFGSPTSPKSKDACVVARVAAL